MTSCIHSPHSPFDIVCVETPGNSALTASLLVAPSEPLLALASLRTHLHHFLFHVFVLLGSPLSSFMYAFVFLASIHRITAIGSFFHSITSSRVFFPLSQLSYMTFLLHPMLMVKEYSIFFSESWFLHEKDMSSMMIHAMYVWNMVMVFAVAFVLYVTFEAPIDVLLRKNSENNIKTFKRIVFYYCILLLVVSILYHIFAMFFMMYLFTPEWLAGVKAAEAANKLLQNATQTTVEALAT